MKNENKIGRGTNKLISKFKINLKKSKKSKSKSKSNSNSDSNSNSNSNSNSDDNLTTKNIINKSNEPKIEIKPEIQTDIKKELDSKNDIIKDKITTNDLKSIKNISKLTKNYSNSLLLKTKENIKIGTNNAIGTINNNNSNNNNNNTNILNKPVLTIETNNDETNLLPTTNDFPNDFLPEIFKQKNQNLYDDFEIYNRTTLNSLSSNNSSTFSPNLPNNNHELNTNNNINNATNNNDSSSTPTNDRFSTELNNDSSIFLINKTPTTTFNNQIKYLGSGGSASVIKINRINHKREIYALKKFMYHQNEDIKNYIKKIISEYLLSINLNNNHHIIKTIGVYKLPLQFQRSWGLIMELCSIDLYTLIKKYSWKSAGYNLKMCIFKQICFGLKFLNENDIVHRDLKPANILISPKGIVKLIDFGNAHFGHEIIGNFNSKIKFSLDYAGTSPYMSPEVENLRANYKKINFDRYKNNNNGAGDNSDINIDNNNNSYLNEMAIDPFRSDYWSLGIILFVLVTQGYPFTDAVNTNTNYLEYKSTYKKYTTLHPQFIQIGGCYNKNFNSTFKNIGPFGTSLKFIKHFKDIGSTRLAWKLCDPNPDTRYTIRDIFMDPYFQNLESCIDESIYESTFMAHSINKDTKDLNFLVPFGSEDEIVATSSGSAAITPRSTATTKPIVSSSSTMIHSLVSSSNENLHREVHSCVTLPQHKYDEKNANVNVNVNVNGNANANNNSSSPRQVTKITDPNNTNNIKEEEDSVSPLKVSHERNPTQQSSSDSEVFSNTNITLTPNFEKSSSSSASLLSSSSLTNGKTDATITNNNIHGININSANGATNFNHPSDASVARNAPPRTRSMIDCVIDSQDVESHDAIVRRRQSRKSSNGSTISIPISSGRRRSSANSYTIGPVGTNTGTGTGTSIATNDIQRIRTNESHVKFRDGNSYIPLPKPASSSSSTASLLSYNLQENKNTYNHSNSSNSQYQNHGILLSKSRNSETSDKLISKKPPLGEIITDQGMVKLQYQENPDDNSTEDTDKGKSGTIDTEDNTNNTNIKTIARELSLINLKSNYNNNNSNKNLDSKYMIVPKESILNSTKCCIKPHRHILYF
ncbi:hypothetical protein B5S31_g453 [[Candida] boidinii]|nr:hypothetical protein B5S31_g453 [[Candida] boidinii]